MFKYRNAVLYKCLYPRWNGNLNMSDATKTEIITTHVTVTILGTVSTSLSQRVGLEIIYSTTYRFPNLCKYMQLCMHVNWMFMSSDNKTLTNCCQTVPLHTRVYVNICMVAQKVTTKLTKNRIKSC